jgi:hypothetical protein
VSTLASEAPTIGASDNPLAHTAMVLTSQDTQRPALPCLFLDRAWRSLHEGRAAPISEVESR